MLECPPFACALRAWIRKPPWVRRFISNYRDERGLVPILSERKSLPLRSLKFIFRLFLLLVFLFISIWHNRNSGCLAMKMIIAHTRIQLNRSYLVSCSKNHRWTNSCQSTSSTLILFVSFHLLISVVVIQMLQIIQRNSLFSVLDLGFIRR